MLVVKDAVTSLIFRKLIRSNLENIQKIFLLVTNIL